MTYDYRAARDRVIGMVRDGDRVVAYQPGPASIKERALLLVLVEFAPNIMPSISALAILLGTNEREVYRLIASCEQKGLLRVERHNGKRSRYHLLTPNPGQPVTPADMSPLTDTQGTPADVSAPPLTDTHPKQTSKADKKADKGCAPASGTPPLALESPPSKPKRKAGSNGNAKPKASKAEPAETSEHRQVVAHYFQTFEASRGSKPAFNGADGKAVARLLKNVNGDVEKACAAITGAFVCWRNDTVSIRLIASDPSQFIGAKPRRTNQPERQNSGIDVFGESI